MSGWGKMGEGVWVWWGEGWVALVLRVAAAAAETGWGEWGGRGGIWQQTDLGRCAVQI